MQQEGLNIVSVVQLPNIVKKLQISYERPRQY